MQGFRPDVAIRLSDWNAGPSCRATDGGQERAELNLIEMRRVMREGGLLVLCLRMHSTSRFALAPGFTEDEVAEVAGLVRWVGFRDIRIVKRKVGREASCVIARR